MTMYEQFNRVFRYSNPPDEDNSPYSLLSPERPELDPSKSPAPPKGWDFDGQPQSASTPTPTPTPRPKKVKPNPALGVSKKTRRMIDDQSKEVKPSPLPKSHELYIRHIAKRDGLDEVQTKAVRDHAHKLHAMDAYAGTRGLAFRFLYFVGKKVSGISGGGRTSRAPHPHE